MSVDDTEVIQQEEPAARERDDLARAEEYGRVVACRGDMLGHAHSRHEVFVGVEDFAHGLVDMPLKPVVHQRTNATVPR